MPRTFTERSKKATASSGTFVSKFTSAAFSFRPSWNALADEVAEAHSFQQENAQTS